MFDVGRFYNIEDAVYAVQVVCGEMYETLGEHRSQIAYQVPQECIEKE